MDPGQYPVTYDVVYPGEMNRWLVLIKWLLILPNAIVYLIFAFAAYFTSFIAWFAILFTGKYPRGLFDFYVGTLRWSARINAYTGLMTDEYPPFRLDQGGEEPDAAELVPVSVLHPVTPPVT